MQNNPSRVIDDSALHRIMRTNTLVRIAMEWKFVSEKNFIKW